ncbi:MAG TPA: tetratricopeptide repeat protein, partial [Planctomycetes bacterium]|nr:tetratricopeptide repeat protein [Planctomycetota bacterium]
EIKPDDADAHNNLANIYIMRGQIDEAIRHFKEALKYDPGYEKAQKGLIKALAHQSENKP